MSKCALRKGFETNYSFSLTVGRVITQSICTPNFFVILSASRYAAEGTMARPLLGILEELEQELELESKEL